MNVLGRDLRYALRSWRRAPGPIAAAVVALALGIGANSAIFSIVAAILLKPLPYQNPERLVMVWQDLRARGGPPRDWISPGLFVEWQQRATAFERLAAVRGWSPNLTAVDEPERLRGAAVTADYFAALGVAPQRGRTFTAADDTPNAAPVVVIADALWGRRFNRDPSLVGRTLVLDGQATTVVGIMPAAFEPAVVDAEIWTPARIDPARAPRGIIVLRVFARLNPGVTLAQAQAAMGSLAAQLATEDPEWERARVSLIPLHDDIVGDVRQMLIVLTIAVALVLCIAAANVASLLLARAAERGREITIRTALGARRGQIVRQLLTESALLGGIGGSLGLLLAWWSVRALVALAPSSAPRLHDVRVDGAVIGFTAAVTCLTVLLAGLAPAVATVRAHLSIALREGARESTSVGRARGALVIAEIAIALVLVVGAALLVQTLIALQHVPLGFEPGNVLTAAVSPPRSQYREPASLRAFYTRLLERAAAIPGVQSAAITNMLPLSGGEFNLSFQIEGRPPSPGPGREPVAGARIVSASYVRTMGMRMVEGREFDARDTENAPGVVLVNQTLARRYWPSASALGAHVLLNDLDATIVGVVGDVHHRGAGTAPGAEMYVPYQQFTARQAIVVLRTRRDPSTIAAPLRAAMHEIDPALPLSNVITMDTLLARTVSQPRFLAALLTGFAVLAAVLALVGVYGLLSFTVSRRVRELGVRMALGASRGRVVTLVLAQSAALLAVGLVAGVALSLALARLLRTLLFGVRPGDPATIVLMSIGIAAASMVASLPPALRASRIDPVVALREE